MRMLKYLLAAIGALGFAFFLIGVFAPKFTYTNEVSINATPDQAWSVFTDPSRTGEWMAGFQSIENISGGELEVGSKWLIMVEDNGEQFEITETVTRVTPEREFAFTLEADVMIANVAVLFEPVGDTTLMQSTTEVEGKSAAWKSLLWMAKSRMEQQGQANYHALKSAIERR